MDLRKIKNSSDCFEIVAVDAYDDSEIAMGWLNCIEEVFEEIRDVKVFGQKTELVGFKIEGAQNILAICSQNKKIADVSIKSIEWPKLSPFQKIWLNAFKEYLRN